MKKIISIFITLAVLLSSTFILSSCGRGSNRKDKAEERAVERYNEANRQASEAESEYEAALSMYERYNELSEKAN